MRQLVFGMVIGLGVCMASCPLSGRYELYLVSINYFTESIDLRIGEEPRPVYRVDGLASGGLHALQTFHAADPLAVRYRICGAENWQRLPHPLGEETKIPAGPAVLCLVIDRQGFLRLLNLADDQRPGARISVFNASTTEVPCAALTSTAGGEPPALWVDDLRPFHATCFTSVLPGEYALAFFKGEGNAGPAGGGDPRVADSRRVTCPDDTYLVLFVSQDLRGDFRCEPRRIAVRHGRRGLFPAEEDAVLTVF